MANVYKGLTVQFGGDTSELQKALKQATSAASDTQSQLKKLNNDLKFDDDNVVALKQKFDLLTDAIGDSNVKLQLYEKTYDQLADTIVTVGGQTTTIKELAEQTENIGLAASEALQAYNNIDASLETVNTQLSKMEKALIDAGEASSNTYIAVNKMSAVQFDNLISDLVSTGNLSAENAQSIYELKARWQELANNNSVYKMVDQYQNLETSITDVEVQAEKFRKQLVDMDVSSISDIGVYFDDAARDIETSVQAIETMDTSVDDYRAALDQLDSQIKDNGESVDTLTMRYELLTGELTALKVKQQELESSFGIDGDDIESIMSAATQMETLNEMAGYTTLSVTDVAVATGLSAEEAKNLANALNSGNWQDVASSFEELALKAGLFDDEMESSAATYVALTKKTEDLHQEMLSASDAYAQAKANVDQLTNELEVEERTLDSLNAELSVTKAKLSSGVFDEEQGENVLSLSEKIEQLESSIIDQNEAISKTSTELAEAQEAAEEAEAVFNDSKVAEEIGKVRDEAMGLDSDMQEVSQEAEETSNKLAQMYVEQEDALESLVQTLSSGVDDSISSWESLQQAISEAFEADGTTELKTELGTLDDAIDSLQTELSKVDTALELDPTNTELVDAKMELLAETTRAFAEEADVAEARLEELGSTSATLAGTTSTIEELSRNTTDAATDAAEAKAKYESLTSQLQAMCDLITEADRLTGELDDSFDLFAEMGKESTSGVIQKMEELGLITEEQGDKLQDMSDAWVAAKDDMDATEQITQYQQLANKVQTLSANASDAADQLAQMRLDEQLESNVSDTSEQVNILSNRLDETATSLTQVNKKLDFDSTNVQTAAERAQLLQKYTGTANEKMSVLRKRISELESSGIEASEKSMYELSKEADEAADNFKTAAKRVQELQDALSDAQKKAEDLADSADDVEDEYKEAKEQVEKYRDALQDAEKAQDDAADALKSAEMAKEWKELNNELDETEASLDDVKSSAQNTNDKIQGLTNNNTQSFQSFMYVISDVGQAIEQMGSQIESALEQALESAKEVSQAFTDMKKTTEGTEEEFDELLDSAKEMSTTSAVSTDTILEIEELGGALGIAADDLDDFAETISNLSIATDLEADEAAEEVGSLINILDDLDTSNLEEFSDALVRLGNNGASTEEDIVDIAERIAAVGSQAGMSTPEILAWASTIASTGSEAESAGTAISNTMSDIETAVAGGGEELELFAEIAGMSAEEFATAWETDPSTAMQEFIVGLSNMEDSGESTISALEELGITSVRQVTNIENLASSISLLDDNLTMSEDAWNGVSDEWGDAGDAANEAEQQSEGLSGTLTILENALQLLGSAVGESLEPLLESLTDVIVWLTEQIENSDGSVVQFIAEISGLSIVTGGATELISTMSNGLNSVSKLFTKSSKTAKTMTATVSTVTDAMGDASTSTELLTTTMETASSGASALKTTLAGGLVAVGITAALYGIEQLVEYIQDLHDEEKEAKENTEELNEVQEELADTIYGTSDAMEEEADSTEDLYTGIDDVNHYTEDLIDSQEDLAESIDSTYSDMFDTISQLDDAQTILESYTGAFDENGEAVELSESQLSELYSAVELYNGILGTSYSVMQDADGAFYVVEEGAEDAEGSVDDFKVSVSELGDEAFWAEIQNSIQENMDEISNEISETTSAQADIRIDMSQIESDFDTLSDEIMSNYDEIADEYGETTAQKLDEVLTAFEENGYQLTEDQEAWLKQAEEIGVVPEGTFDQIMQMQDDYAALNEELEANQDTLEELNEEYSWSAELQEQLAEEAENGGDSMQNFLTGLGDYGQGVSEILQSISDTGVKDFAAGLEEAGISVEEFTSLSEDEMLDMVSNWDGDAASVGQLWNDTMGDVAADFGTSLTTMNLSASTGLDAMQAIFSGDFETLKTICSENGIEIPETIASAMEDGSFWTSDAATEMISGIASSLDDQELYNLASNLGVDIPKGVSESMSENGELTEEESDKLAQGIIDTFAEKMGIASPSKEMESLGDYVIAGLIEGMQDTESVSEAVSTLSQTIIDTFTETMANFGTTVTTTLDESAFGQLGTTMYSYGTEAGTQLANGISDSSSSVTSAVNIVLNSATSNIGAAFQNSMSSKGEAGVGAFVDAINDGQKDAKTAGETLGKKVWNGGLGSDFRDDMETAGKKGAQNFINGVKNDEKLTAAKEAGEKLATKAYNGAKSKNGDVNKEGYAYYAGVQFAKGFGNGINSKDSWVYDMAYDLAEQAIQAVNDAQESASPSKVMKQVGGWFGEGYAEGIESEYDEIERVAAQAAAVAIEAASTDAVASINYETTAQAATASAVLDALDRLDTNTSKSENTGTVVNQTFKTKVVRSDSDLYTAAPIIYRNAMREAARV